METVHLLNKNTEKLRIVKIWIVFKRIGVIDFRNEKFNAEVHIESSWENHEEIILYDPNLHWNPKIYIKNGLSDLIEEFHYLMSQDRKIITEIRDIKGNFLF